MSGTMIGRWASAAFSARRTPVRKAVHRPRAKLGLEGLEDRTVPAPVVYNGTNGNDGIILEPLGSDNYYAYNYATDTGTYFYAPDGVVINGLDGNDEIQIFAGSTSDISVNGGNGSDSVLFGGTASADTFYANGSAVSRIGDNAVNMSNVEGTGIYSFGGDDSMIVQAGLAIQTTFHGGNHTTGDVLYIEGSGSADVYTVTPTITRTGDQPVWIGDSTESISMSTLGGDDTVSVSAGLSIPLTYAGGSGSDELIMSGTSGADTFNSTGSVYSRTFDQAIYLQSDVETVAIFAGGGNDTANLTPSTTAVIGFNGEGGTDTLNTYGVRTNTGTGSGYYSYPVPYTPAMNIYFSTTEILSP